MVGFGGGNSRGLSQCSLFSVVVKLEPLDFLHLHAVTLKGLGTRRMTVVLDFFFFSFLTRT